LFSSRPNSKNNDASRVAVVSWPKNKWNKSTLYIVSLRIKIINNRRQKMLQNHQPLIPSQMCVPLHEIKQK
jgi:hypothetical protein